MKKSIFLFLIVLLVNFSCSEEQQSVDNNQIDYEQLASQLSDDLNQIAADIRLNKADFSNVNQVRKSAKMVLNSKSSNDSQVLTEFSNSFDVASALSGAIPNARILEQEILVSEYQYRIIEQVDILWEQASSIESYRQGLVELFEITSTDDAPETDKQPASIYLISQIVALDFIETNLDLLGYSSPENGRIQSWWDDWGQCVAGIVGGAGGGALAGATYGGAGCTVVLPLIGTVACGTVGAVVGGISGGLLASSSSACSSKEGGGSACPRPNCPQTKCYCA